jgi:hypothetical protein
LWKNCDANSRALHRQRSSFRNSVTKPVIEVIDYDAHSIEERRIQKIDEVFECGAAKCSVQRGCPA